MNALRILVNILVLLALLSGARLCQAADDLDKAQRALKIISDFANSMCNNVPLKGSSSSVELTGAAKAELSKLVKKLADLNIQGVAKYQRAEYEGLLQKDLNTALKDSTTCKQNIFRDLQGKLLPKPVSELDGQSQDLLASAAEACSDTNFEKARPTLARLAAKFPSHKRVLDVIRACDQSEMQDREVSIELVQDGSIFRSGTLLIRPVEV